MERDDEQSSQQKTKLEALEWAESRVRGPLKGGSKPHTWGYRVKRGEWTCSGACGSYPEALRAVRVEKARQATAHYLGLKVDEVRVYSGDDLPRTSVSMFKTVIENTVCRRVERAMLGDEVETVTFDHLDGRELYELLETASHTGFGNMCHNYHLKISDLLEERETRKEYLLALVEDDSLSWELEERIGDLLSDQEWRKFVMRLAKVEGVEEEHHEVRR